ncbi:MAG: YihA family ribosome biogenesis GTP-binding protein [bacterium]|nr:YihA family ribosome biogenesis GTP-binding protein [bacterium]
MKMKNVYFLKSCLKAEQFPQFPYPEFAFFGRSNVGKSSLINMLMGRKNLVKTGSKPGVTKAINFFVVDDNTSIVDLPGYGYAKLPAELRKTFLPLIKEFIKNREHLKLAFLLIDIRRVPDQFEHDIIDYLIEHEVPVVITLTKCDKLSKNQRMKNVAKIRKALGIDQDAMFFTSAEKREGKNEILKLIDEYRQ